MSWWFESRTHSELRWKFHFSFQFTFQFSFRFPSICGWFRMMIKFIVEIFSVHLIYLRRIHHHVRTFQILVLVQSFIIEASLNIFLYFALLCFRVRVVSSQFLFSAFQKHEICCQKISGVRFIIFSGISSFS